MEQGTGSLPQMACFKRDFLGRAEMAGVTERGGLQQLQSRLRGPFNQGCSILVSHKGHSHMNDMWRPS